MSHLRTFLALAALGAATSVSAIEAASNGDAQWVCGGAGEQERMQLKGLESQASAELLFVTEKRGGYLADVDFVVRDQKGVTVLQGRADGPKCLLSMPAGSYRVEASYLGSRRSASFHVARAPGNRTRTVLTFPLDPSETIAPSPEEKAGVKVK